MIDPAERKRWRPRRPSPALVIALLALFVALGGTAVAAGVVPLAKRALVANTALNAQKLGGLTGQQVASLAPPPNVYYKTAAWTLAGGADPKDFTVSCDPGEHVISGGYDNPDGGVLAQDTHPTADYTGWVVNLSDLSPTVDTSGTLYAVCVRT